MIESPSAMQEAERHTAINEAVIFLVIFILLFCVDCYFWFCSRRGHIWGNGVLFGWSLRYDTLLRCLWECFYEASIGRHVRWLFFLFRITMRFQEVDIG